MDLAAGMEAALQARKRAEESALSKAAQDAARKHWTLKFEGRGPPVVLDAVSLRATQTIRFEADIADDDRLSDLCQIVRARLALKDKEAVRLTYVRVKQGGRIVRRELPVQEEPEEEDAGLQEDGDEEEEDVDNGGDEAEMLLDPELTLREVGLFRNRCTVQFVVTTELRPRMPPQRSAPLKMPNVALMTRLREFLRRRHKSTVVNPPRKLRTTKY